MKPQTLLFYCQHSLGMGHLVRSLAIAEALSRRFQVVLLNGGRLPAGVVPPAGVEVVDLPPVGIGPDGLLVSRDRRRSVDRAMQLRRERIRGIFRKLRPAALFIELFPFGRRKFSGELVPLLESVRADGLRAPVVLCSLRDILVNGRQDQRARDERASTMANRYFDAVLVHADPAFARLEDSFLPLTPLAVPVHYTGFVVPPTEGRRCSHHRGEHVLVSAGGGMAGEPLLEAAVAAQALLWPTDAIPMRIVAGPFYPEKSWRSLRAAARSQPGLSVRRQVPDLCGELRGARASVSQCGYNTALDLLRAEVPALVVPFGDAKENEQSDRARRLARGGAVQVLDAKDLSPTALAEAIRTVVRFRPRPMALDLDGARHTAELTARLVHQRVARGAA